MNILKKASVIRHRYQYFFFLLFLINIEDNGHLLHFTITILDSERSNALILQ